MESNLDRMRTCLEPACCWERKRNRPRGLWIRLFTCNSMEGSERKNEERLTVNLLRFKLKNQVREGSLPLLRKESFFPRLTANLFSSLIHNTQTKGTGSRGKKREEWGTSKSKRRERWKLGKGCENSQKRGTHENVSLSFFSLSSITQFELFPCLKNMNFYFRQDFLLPLLFSLFLHLSFRPFLPLAAQAQWSKKWSTTYKRDSESIRLLTHFLCVIVNELGSWKGCGRVCFTSWEKYWQNSDRKNLWLMSRIVIYDVEK